MADRIFDIWIESAGEDAVPGHGGYAAVVKDGDTSMEYATFTGGNPSTSRVVMLLTAVKEAIQSLPPGVCVIHTTSSFVVNVSKAKASMPSPTGSQLSVGGVSGLWSQITKLSETRTVRWVHEPLTPDSPSARAELLAKTAVI